MNNSCLLSSLGDFKNGLNFAKHKVNIPMKIIGIPDFGEEIAPNYDALSTVDESVVPSEYYLQSGDILFVRSNGNRNLVGRTMIIENIQEKVGYSGFCIRFRITSTEVDPYYLLYYLKSPMMRRQLSRTRQSNINNINQDSLGNLLIRLPKLSEQKEIAQVVSTIDRKISLNNAINTELETTARTLYDYWFTQFNFPNANGVPYKSSGGAMVWSEEQKCEIPEKWESQPISKLCNFISGFPFASENYASNGRYRIITIKNVQDNGVNLETDNYLNNLPERLPNNCVLKIGDILMSLTGNVGRIGLMYATDCLLNQRVALVRPTGDDYYAFTYYTIKSGYFQNTVQRMASGSSQANLSPVDTGKIKIAYDTNVVRLFNSQVAPIIGKILNNLQQNKELTELRDFLLPLLMNGQVTVQTGNKMS